MSEPRDVDVMAIAAERDALRARVDKLEAALFTIAPMVASITKHTANMRRPLEELGMLLERIDFREIDQGRNRNLRVIVTVNRQRAREMFVTLEQVQSFGVATIVGMEIGGQAVDVSIASEP